MHNEQKSVEVKDVEASLSHGRIYTGKIWEIIISLIAVLAILAIVVSSNGKKINKESRHRGERYYLAAFKKYANREVEILYSPKYDEVLFLKSSAEKDLQ